MIGWRFFVPSRFPGGGKGKREMEELKQLQERRLKLHNDIKEQATLLDRDADAEKQGEWQSKWDELNTAYDDVMAKIEAKKADLTKQKTIDDRLAAIDQYADAPVNELIGRDGGTVADGPINRDRFQQTEPRREVLESLALDGWFRQQALTPDVGEVTDEHRQAAAACGVNLQSPVYDIRLCDTQQFNRFRNDFRSGRNVTNALGTADGTSGGFLQGETLLGTVEQAQLAYGGILQVCQVIRTPNDSPMRWPTANDTGNTGRRLGESKPVTTNDPSFAQVVWYAYKYTSDEVLVPTELLQNSVLNLPVVLGEMLGKRLGRIQNSEWTTGDGNAKPRGIVTDAAAGITAAAVDAITYDELIDLEHSIDPSRRNGAGYMFHDSVLQYLRKLKDGNSRFLWQAGANTGAPDTLNTRSYTINQDMASTIAASAITVLFGQLNQYKVRQVAKIRLYRLQERHRENDQDAFLAFVQSDGKLLDAGDNPVKKLTQHA